MKRLSLELGGNAPFLVFDDADLDGAVAALIAAKFRNAGQTCVCADRVLVQRAVHDEFARRLTAAVDGLVLGHGLVPGVTIGPMINRAGADKARDAISDAIALGATVLCAGGGPATAPAAAADVEATGDGNFVSPTVLAGCTAAMAAWSYENFSPIVALAPFDTEDEAVTIANDSPVGLAGYVCTRDLGRAWRVAEALEVGLVGVNEGILATDHAPFGC